MYIKSLPYLEWKHSMAVMAAVVVVVVVEGGLQRVAVGQSCCQTLGRKKYIQTMINGSACQWWWNINEIRKKKRYLPKGNGFIVCGTESIQVLPSLSKNYVMVAYLPQFHSWCFIIYSHEEKVYQRHYWTYFWRLRFGGEYLKRWCADWLPVNDNLPLAW